MATPLIPQEIYLLERYASRDYFEKLVDAFAGCVKAAEDALAKFLLQLPADYRERPLWQQPDATWGEVVLPNLRATLSSLNTGLVKISSGDLSGLGFAGNVGTAFAAIARDYASEWMQEPELSDYDACMRRASMLGTNISATEQGEWLPGELTIEYNLDSRGQLEAPPTWPTYKSAPGVQVRTGVMVPRNGVYTPNHTEASTQFLINGYDAPQCAVRRRNLNPRVFSAARDLFDTTWVLVERSADSGGGLTGAMDPVAAGDRLRCVAGEACTKSGWWMTPAGEQSRRKFVQGEILPAVAGDYGVTIWQWSVDQDG